MGMLDDVDEHMKKHTTTANGSEVEIIEDKKESGFLQSVWNGVGELGNMVIRWIDSQSIRRWIIVSLICWVIFLFVQFVFMLTIDLDHGRMNKLEEDNKSHYEKEARLNDRLSKLERRR